MENFPTEYFLNTTVRLLEYIQYRDSNYTREERIENLHYAYNKAAHHFAQPRQQQLLKIDPKRLQASLQTIVGMVVYSWAKVPKECMVDLSIHYTYTLVLDDSSDDPYPTMVNYFNDLQAGREQAHPWWALVNEHFPNVLRHFGPFCSLNIIRSTLDCKYPGFIISHLKKLTVMGCQFLKDAGLSSTTLQDFQDPMTTPSFFDA
jgi:trichodiene synthase